MTLTSVPQFILSKCNHYNSYTILDGQNERVGFCGFWPTPDGATRTITDILFLSGTVVTSADDILVQIESVGADGLPAGIIAADRSGTVNVSAINTFYEVTLTSPYELTSGALLAVTAKMLNSSKSLRLAGSRGITGSSLNGCWCVADIVGAGWVTTSVQTFSAVLKCSTGEYLTPFGTTISKVSSTAITTSSDPRYIGNKLVTGVSARLCGVRLEYLDMDCDISIKLVDASGDVLKGDDTVTDMVITLDSEYRVGTGANTLSELSFPCPKTLTASTPYYLIFVPISASNTLVFVSSYYSTVAKGCLAFIPSGWTLNKITSPSAWSITETDTDVCVLAPMFDQIDIGSSGGSSPRFGDMTGGMVKLHWFNT